MREIDTLDSQIAQMRKEIDEIKTPQGFKGDSWIFYRNVISDADWDLQGTIVPSNTFRHFKITFVPDINTAIAAKLVVYYQSNVGTDNIMPVNGTNNQWWFTVNSEAGGNMSFKFKFIVMSTQEGTVSFVEL